MGLAPTLEKFKAHAREVFGFLASDFGFKEVRPPFKSTNPFLVCFSNGSLHVFVEGEGWGSIFRDKAVHVFGIGGTATIHLAALLDIDSVDSSGWRNRAARGIVQLQGSGDRMVANLGKWRGRTPSKAEWDKLRRCRCPACTANRIDGLKANGLNGFSNRATYNLWVLLDEARWLEKHLRAKTYAMNYRRRLDNSTYLPLVTQVLNMKKREERPGEGAWTELRQG